MKRKIKRNSGVDKIQNSIFSMSSAYKSPFSLDELNIEDDGFASILQKMLDSKSIQDSCFDEDLYEKLHFIYKKYHPLDVFKSLSIAELWLPNLSSFVKFSLAINAFLSLDSGSFSDKRIDTYDIFSEFINSVFEILPHNSMIEDFHPVRDWGQVKFQYNNKSYKILFGSYGFSDVVGFIDSFLIKHRGDKQAIKDFRELLQLHENLLNFLGDNSNEDESESFLLSTPSFNFWKGSNNWFDQLSLENINSDLIVELGETKKNDNNFYDRFEKSEINQYCYFLNSGKLLPLSIRNTFIVLFEYYHSKNNYLLSTCAENISLFLNSRLHSCITDNFLLRSNSNILPYEFSCYLHENGKHYFFLPILISQISQELEEDIKQIVGLDGLGLQSMNGYGGMYIPNDGSGKVNFLDLNIIIILCDTTTKTLLIPRFKSKNFKIFSLSNFLSIMDSVDDESTFCEYLNFVENNEKKALFMNYDIDSYATFKDTSGVLEDGAIDSTIISLDSHWGMGWKYKHLISKYINLPKFLPDSNYNWVVAKEYDDNICLYAKNKKAISWGVGLEFLYLNFLFDFQEVDANLHLINPRLIELCAEAFCDAFSKRLNLFNSLNLGGIRNFTFNLKVCSWLNTDYIDESYSFNKNVIDGFLIENVNDDSVSVRIYLNLKYCFYSFQNSVDASFQVEMCIEILNIINEVKHIEGIDVFFELLNNTKSWPLRMKMEVMNNPFDLLNESPVSIPDKYYKLARKKLAVILKGMGYHPKIYSDIFEAKEIINSSANALRQLLHGKIKNFNKEKLLIILLTNYQKLISEHYIKNTRHRQSLQHEVVYDRTESLSEVDSKFVRDSMNYRYLIECCLMLDSNSKNICDENDLLELLGETHWLINLYQYSDTLHFELDVGGIEINSNYIPEVFFNGCSDDIRDNFDKEIAAYKLGLGLNSKDMLHSIISENNYELLNNAFYSDLGFSFSNLCKALFVLSNWSSFNSLPIKPVYKESFGKVVEGIVNKLADDGVNSKEVNFILKFLILDKTKINILEGSSNPTFDVPIGDYNKRTSRLNIRPLVLLDDNETLLWVSGCTYRTEKIWLDNVEAGYLPADFPWENTVNLVGNSKVLLEKQLEKKAFDVLKRKTQYSVSGLDLITRFKKLGFPKIGDYDVLSYFPNSNIWVMIECKYNQPAFCSKDMKRLRDKIFGENSESKSQISKIKTRYDFLKNNLDKVRNALNWPVAFNEDPTILNLYVSKNTYWWFRNPPYKVDVDFIQIDYLDQWLTDNLSKY